MDADAASINSALLLILPFSYSTQKNKFSVLLKTTLNQAMPKDLPWFRIVARERFFAIVVKRPA